MTNSERVATTAKLIDPSLDKSIDSLLPLADRPTIERYARVGFDPEQLIPTPTYVEVGVEKLTALANAVGLNAKTPQIIEVFRAMTMSWGDKKVGDLAGCKSDVSDDGAPFEFSIAFDPNRVELRVLLEAQGSSSDLLSNWQAGLELNRQLAARFNISLDRFEQIADLYSPTNSAAKFSIWHAVCFYPHKEPGFKIYLNPQAQSPDRAAAIIEESLVRLGFPHAWPTLAETAAQRGPDKDEFVYFSLDLAAHSHARVKVYLRHHDATPTELEAALSIAGNYVAGDAIEFCKAMAPECNSFASKPAISAFAWVEGDDLTPSSGTLHLPISNYVTDDGVVCDRLAMYFFQHRIPLSTYNASISALSVRRLNAGVGMHSYTSLRREQQQQRVTTYLNPEVNVVKPPQQIATAPQSPALRLLADIALDYKSNSIGNHPFFTRLEREPGNLTHLWLFFANAQVGIIDHFTRRLALIVDRIEDENIRSVFAHQLHEELGNGNAEHVHHEIFNRFIQGLEVYKPEVVSTAMLSPGAKLSQDLEVLYADANPYIGVGAAIVMEIRGEQRDEIITKELIRTQLDRSVASWFYFHGELENDHADEVLQLARQIDDRQDGDKMAVSYGLEMTSKALWDFCNGLYRVCFV